MRRARTIQLALIALASLASTIPTTAHQNTSPVDYARGTGVVIADPLKPERIGATLTFDARRSNGVVSGTVKFRHGSVVLDPAATWDGQVTCILVDGKLAIIGGKMKRAGTSTVIGRFAMLIRNTIDMDFGEDPALLRYGTNLSSTCFQDEFRRLPVALVSANGRVHDGAPTSLSEELL